MATGVQHRIAGWVKGSAVPYLAVAIVAVLLARYMPYLIRDDIRIKGQPLYIAVELAIFPASIVLWLFYKGARTRSVWLATFLVAMLVAWAVRLVLMIVHGDNFNHLAWLTPVFLLMLLFKTPTWRESWTGLVILGWGLAAILVTAYVLEVTGVYEALYLPEGYTEFQQAQYWLPLDGFLGVEGRWTGPFGHNTRSGFAAAMILLIACGQRRRGSLALGVIGGYFLLVTSVRASYLAAVTGLVILLVFSQRGWIARIPMWVRWTGMAALALLGAAAFTLTGAGLTGRQDIWPAFWALFPPSPIIGVGRAGIIEAGGITALREDAHNILLDELVRFGVVGFIVMIGALAVGVVISFRGAARGFAAGAAVVSAYLITSLTDIQNDWIQLYYHSQLVLLAVVAAGRWLESDASPTAPDPPAA